MFNLIPAHQIALRVAEIGRSISRDFEGRPLTVVGVLNGSVILVADLIRSIQIPHRVGFVQASSYSGATTDPGTLSLDMTLMPEVEGRDVLIVDDIFDTGRTLHRLVDEIKKRKPSSLRTAVLLWKQGRCEVDVTPDYFGFEIPNSFVVGYGLDYGDDYRHLSDIWVLEQTDLGPDNGEREGR